MPEARDTLSEQNSAISSEKERLSTLEVIKAETSSFPEAHAILAESVKEQVHHNLEQRLKSLGQEDFYESLNLASASLSKFIDNFVNNPEVPEKYKNVASEYLESLKVWSGTINFYEIAHPYIQEAMSKKGVAAEELNILVGYILQDEAVGCQSGMYKQGEKVYLWHTEEDVADNPGDRFDKSRILQVSVRGGGGQTEDRYCFVYPDLLPGPAYCFGKDFFYSVDSQRAAEHNGSSDVPANFVCWAMWRLGKDADAREIVDTFSPYTSGYTINIAKVVRDDGGAALKVGKIEFAYGLVSEFTAAESKPMVSLNVPEKGSALFGIDDPTYNEVAPWYQEREDRATRLVGKLGNLNFGINPYSLFRMLGNGLGNSKEGFGFANSDVKSYVVTELSAGVTKVYAGPASADKSDWDSKVVRFEL